MVLLDKLFDSEQFRYCPKDRSTVSWGRQTDGCGRRFGPHRHWRRGGAVVRHEAPRVYHPGWRRGGDVAARCAGAAQPERMQRIGVLMPLAADDAEGQGRIAAFLQELQQLG